ncbi:hypothetical protein [Alishewanella longhuensis]
MLRYGDDYYLAAAERQQLAAKIHPLFSQRGVPGTHDIQRAIADAQHVLAGLAVALPVFDKALDDRLADQREQRLQLLIVGVVFRLKCAKRSGTDLAGKTGRRGCRRALAAVC